MDFDQIKKPLAIGLIMSFTILACKMVSLEKCLGLNGVETGQLKKEIKKKITNFYLEEGQGYKITSTACLSDSMIEVRTITNFDVIGCFQFDLNGNMLDVIHELPPVN